MDETIEKNKEPDYGFIDAYFGDAAQGVFKDDKEESEEYLRFIDLLCMLEIYRNEQEPEMAVSRIGALPGDEELVRALEPHGKAVFPEKKKVRAILAGLLNRSRQTLEGGDEFPLSRLLLSGYLSNIEALALLIAWAGSVNRKYEKSFAVLQGVTDGYFRGTVGLCVDLGSFFLEEEENSLSELLNPDSFLNAVMLKPWDNPGLFAETARPLILRTPALNYLCGNSYSLGELSYCAAYHEPVTGGYVCHREEFEELSRVYENCGSSGEGEIIELSAQPGEGKRHLMRMLSAETNQALLAVDFLALSALSPEKQSGLTSDIVLKTALERALLYFYAIPEKAGESPEFCRIFSTLLAYLPVVFLGTSKPLGKEATSLLKARFYRISIPEADNASQLRLWQEAAENRGAVFSGDVSLGEIVSKFTLSPGRIIEAVNNCIMSGAGEENGEAGHILKKSQLEEQIRRICSVAFGENAKRLSSPFEWEDLIVDPESEKLLRMVCDRVRLKSRVNDDFGFGRKLPYGRGIAVVLYGPPGTGKTMAAQVLAKELGLDIYRIDLSQISSKYIGETEKNLGAVFDAAKNSNAILFFDEADSLFSKRTEVSSSNDKYANAETAYLLQKIEEYAGMSILATNNMQNFDAAFKRRMTFLIPIGIPDEATRLELWENAFPKATPLSDDIDFEVLARAAEISGSFIKSSAVAAAYRAAAEERSVNMNDIAEALDLECMKTGKMGVKNDVMQALYNG